MLRPAAQKRFRFATRSPTELGDAVNLGQWPGKTIDAARIDARAYMNLIAEGGDPSGEKKRNLQTLRTKSVKTLADLAAALFVASKMTGVRDSTLAYWQWLHIKHLAPRLGDSRLPDITAGVIRKALREIGATAGPTTANRAFALLRRAFNFGLEEEHVTISPMVRMKPLFEEGSRSRVLTDHELKAFWTIAQATKKPPRSGAKSRDDLSVSRAMGLALQLCLVTAQRSGEVIGIRWSELDIEARQWVLPPERTKANREHVISLSEAAIGLIQEASEIAAMRLGRAPIGNDPLFPTPLVGRAARDATGALEAAPRAVARLSLGRAMARLCEAAQIENASAHDLRRTASTSMASDRLGVLSEVVARVLNHAPPGLGVTAIYNRHNYLREKRRALDGWAELLCDIVTGEHQRQNVVLLASAR